jgi:hypothetical protein
MAGQQKLEIPFGTPINAYNRWVKLSGVMPWEKIEEIYSKNFTGENGQEAKSSRLAFGALYIQNRLAITDEETVNQILENPSMQYFCGFESYTIEKPFDASLMVHFRKRISAEMMREISEEMFTSQVKKAIDKEKIGDDNGGDDNNNDDNNGGETKPQGTMLLDATCCTSDIHYPTDIGLLNHSRELLECVIDDLHGQLKKLGIIKPRTYREVARRAYLAYVRKRKHTKGQLRLAIRQQLECVRRNLDSITKQVELGADLTKLSMDLYQKLQTIAELYLQQKSMFDTNTHSIENRIVSISQPHLRPIVRGKVGTPVEFGAKIATALVGGFTFIINLGYDNFSEAKLLKASAEEYKRIFGFYPKVIIGDKAYATSENRSFCKSLGIRLSAPRRGRKTDDFKEAERRQLYEDSCKRNAIEGSYGVGKRKYGLGLIMTKLYDTTLTAISFGFFVVNMERFMRLLVLRFYMLLLLFANNQGVCVAPD